MLLEIETSILMTPSLTKADTHKQRHSEDAHQIVKFHLIWWTTEKKRERKKRACNLCEDWTKPV